ncbi:MAG: metal-dependent transcriptional regulator [Clostridiales bacterium]|nr:metal-dependent transcriptional regulator [Clostridiales bacterium]
MILRESAENYLEAIYVLSLGSAAVRSVDVATELGVSKPSVSVAMKNLREGGYVEMDANAHITLTPAGLAVAVKMYERHVVLTKWLVVLGVPEATAALDACKIEHVISAESFAAIKSLAEKA